MEYVFNIGSFSSELVCDVKNMDLWLACLGVIQVRYSLVDVDNLVLN